MEAKHAHVWYGDLAAGWRRVATEARLGRAHRTGGRALAGGPGCGRGRPHPLTAAALAVNLGPRSLLALSGAICLLAYGGLVAGEERRVPLPN